MTFEELFEELKKLTPEQRKTEVCGFESVVGQTTFCYWASDLLVGEDGRPALVGTDDVQAFTEEELAALKAEEVEEGDGEG